MLARGVASFGVPCWLLLADLLLLACGKAGADDVVGDAPPVTVAEGCGFLTSGSRLKAQRLVADDGSFQDMTASLGWYDSLLDTNCRFAPAADGVLRCLPNAYGSPGFSDPACSELMWETAPYLCGASPRYLRQQTPLECPVPGSYGQYVIHSMGEAVTPTAYYREDSDGTCAESAVGEGDLAGPFHLTAGVVPPSEFVAATVAETLGSRIVTQHLLAEDGALGESQRFPVSDRELGAPCIVRSSADGSRRCMPDASDLGGRYADASCSQELAWEPDACSLPLRFFATSEVSADPDAQCLLGCNPSFTYRIFELGAPSMLTTGYARNSESDCQMWTESEPLPYAPIGAEVPPTALAGFTDRETRCSPFGAGGSRLRVHGLAADDGVFHPNGGYWVDSELGTRCEFYPAGDGEMRCLPVSLLSAGLFFKDAACTELLADRSSECQACSSEPFVRRFDYERRTCSFSGTELVPSRVHSHTRTPYTGDALYHLVDGVTDLTCAPLAPDSANREYYEFYELGAEIPPTRFVAARLEAW